MHIPYPSSRTGSHLAGLRVEDCADIRHPPISLFSVQTLLWDGCRIQRHVPDTLTCGIATPIPLFRQTTRPLGNRLLCRHSGTRGFGRPLHRRSTHAQTAHSFQHLFGPLGKRVQHPGQCFHLTCCRRLLSFNPEFRVSRKPTVMAMLAVIIGATISRPAEQCRHVARPVPLEFGRVLAIRTTHARPLVPPFFRSSRAASNAQAPIR